MSNESLQEFENWYTSLSKYKQTTIANDLRIIIKLTMLNEFMKKLLQQYGSDFWWLYTYCELRIYGKNLLELKLENIIDTISKFNPNTIRALNSLKNNTQKFHDEREKQKTKLVYEVKQNFAAIQTKRTQLSQKGIWWYCQNTTLIAMNIWQHSLPHILYKMSANQSKIKKLFSLIAVTAIQLRNGVISVVSTSIFYFMIKTIYSKAVTEKIDIQHATITRKPHYMPKADHVLQLFYFMTCLHTSYKTGTLYPVILGMTSILSSTLFSTKQLKLINPHIVLITLLVTHTVINEYYNLQSFLTIREFLLDSVKNTNHQSYPPDQLHIHFSSGLQLLLEYLRDRFAVRFESRGTINTYRADCLFSATTTNTPIECDEPYVAAFIT